MPLRTCSKCEFQYFDEEAEDARHEAVCRHLGVQTPAEIEALRKNYGLSRSEFARLTGLGEATIARWERGALIQNAANDRYLHLLRWEENIKRLLELEDGSKDQREVLAAAPGTAPAAVAGCGLAGQETSQREEAPRATKARKKHFIAVPKEGGYELCRLKDWLREHPEENPISGDPRDSTSHQLRDALQKKGWTIEEVVVCFKPEA